MSQGLKPKRTTRWKTGPGKDSMTFRSNVLAAIKSEWPTYPTEIIRKLNLPGKKADLLLVRYHVDQLAKEGHIRVKKVDRATVCWPKRIEERRHS